MTLSDREIAEKIVRDVNLRLVSLKPLYDSVDLGEALIRQTLDAARSEARAEAEERVKGLRDALERLVNPTPGVKMLPPWAVGIARAALSAYGEPDLGGSSGAGAEGSALAQCTGANETPEASGERDPTLDLHDKIEGLESELFEAVRVAYRRGAMTWAHSNYPQWAKQLADEMRTLLADEGTREAPSHEARD